MSDFTFRRAEKRSGKHFGKRGDFWSKVDTSGGSDACWPWLAAKMAVGYGSVREPGTIRQIGAHRLAYMLTRGPIPDGYDVMHLCDNRICVNPSHLRIGTRADNMADCVAKNRQQHGERHAQAKLTVEAVVAIRSAVASGITYQSLADAYGVDPMTIRDAAIGRTWASVRTGLPA